MASAEASRLERELAQARTAAIANGLGVKSRLQSLQFRYAKMHIEKSILFTLSCIYSYKEQIEKVSRLKDETVRAILKNSQDIANFKQEVSRHLQELRDFAEVD